MEKNLDFTYVTSGLEVSFRVLTKVPATKISTIKAAVMLPFMTDGKGNRDEQTRMVEYYEG